MVQASDVSDNSAKLPHPLTFFLKNCFGNHHHPGQLVCFSLPFSVRSGRFISFLPAGHFLSNLAKAFNFLNGQYCTWMDRLKAPASGRIDLLSLLERTMQKPLNCSLSLCENCFVEIFSPPGHTQTLNEPGDRKATKTDTLSQEFWKPQSLSSFLSSHRKDQFISRQVPP